MTSHTTTQVVFLVDCVNALGVPSRHSIPEGQARTPELAVSAVRMFCRHADEWPLQSVECVGVRTTVLTLFGHAAQQAEQEQRRRARAFEASR